jgi:hypothetical protein
VVDALLPAAPALDLRDEDVRRARLAEERVEPLLEGPLDEFAPRVPVSAITGMRAVLGSVLKSRMVSKPLIPGIARSRTMTSGRRRRAWLKPSRPLVARCTSIPAARRC